MPRRLLFSCLALAAGLVLSAPAAEPAIAREEAETFGRTLADLFNSGRTEEFDHYFDLFTLGTRGLAGLPLDDRNRSEMLTGLVSGMRESIKGQLQHWKSGRFIRVHEVDGETRVYLRVIAADGSFNFFDFVCGRKANGGLKALDFHSCLTGELVSATIRQGLLPVVVEMNRSLLEKLARGDSAYVQALGEVQRAARLVRDGKAAEAVAVYAALPAEVRAKKIVLLGRIQAAQRADHAAYLAVIKDWEAAFPGDPTLDALAIDGAVLEGDYRGAAGRLTALQRTTGPDGYLEMLRAAMLDKAGEPAAAVTTVRHALALEPTLTRAYDTWFAIELRAKDWPGLVAALDDFHTAHPRADLWPVIEKAPDWAGFRDSAEGKAWHAGPPAAAAATP